MAGRRHALGLVVLIAGCSSDAPPKVAALEVDHLMTVSLQLGGDLLVTGRLDHCSPSPTTVAYADGLELARVDAATLFTVDPVAGEAADGALRFQMAIAASALVPLADAVPLAFDLELEAHCEGVWVRSPPYPMTYLPTLASLAPPFRPARFWAAELPGDLWVCEDSTLVLYRAGATPDLSLPLGFPCSATDMANGFGGRRYLHGAGVGLAALDADSTLAWSLPFDLVEAELDSWRDPVVLRDVANVTELVVLDRATGADKVGPLALPQSDLGPLARAPNDDILVLLARREDAPQALAYSVWRLKADGTDLGLLEVARYNWHAPPYVAEFADDGAAIYIAAAPNDDLTRFISKVDTTTGAVLWSTPPEAGWLYPLGEARGRAIVASDAAFVWLDPQTGAPVSAPFAPDSKNSFLRALAEEDGSIVMLADDTSGIAQGLYLFGPDGHSTLRLHPGAALFRFMTPGWGEGTLVSFFNEVHWIYGRAGYDAMIVSP
ncbi:MAG: hypothetical protein HY903_10095 [Deltaproteobacteria bacterium]|nr:hypothetical protein [Deltaproteobacteria bacterium]